MAWSLIRESTVACPTSFRRTVQCFSMPPRRLRTYSLSVHRDLHLSLTPGGSGHVWEQAADLAASHDSEAYEEVVQKEYKVDPGWHWCETRVPDWTHIRYYPALPFLRWNRRRRILWNRLRSGVNATGALSTTNILASADFWLFRTGG